MKRVCVYCGSSPGARPDYMRVAAELGTLLASRRLGLVYGGASVGLMGALADAALEAGGEVTGVIPRSFSSRVGHRGLARLVEVDTMHERKAMMFDMADAFIALPGGIGTLEEVFEVLTWSQLGYHVRPVGLLNTAGYYDRLLEFLDHTVEERFVRPEHRRMLAMESDAARLLQRLEDYTAPNVEKWLDR